MWVVVRSEGEHSGATSLRSGVFSALSHETVKTVDMFVWSVGVRSTVTKRLEVFEGYSPAPQPSFRKARFGEDKFSKMDIVQKAR